MLVKLYHLLPESFKQPIRLFKNFLWSLPYRGTGRWCPVCGKGSRKFRHAGIVRREDAQCMRCFSLERHRFTWLYFQKMTNLFDGTPKQMLHIAPEQCFEKRLREKLGHGYITADLNASQVAIRMDITQIQYPDESFDVIYCSHVLEHVQDDRKAMREFHRTLKKNGWAILLVPVTEETTFEDSSITEPQERLRVFGQEDHVRRYGRDYIDRLKEAGFEVKTLRVTDLFNEGEIELMGLTPSSGEIYYCRKD